MFMNYTDEADRRLYAALRYHRTSIKEAIEYEEANDRDAGYLYRGLRVVTRLERRVAKAEKRRLRAEARETRGVARLREKKWIARTRELRVKVHTLEVLGKLAAEIA